MALKKISIKQLTLLGFLSTVLPLVLVLIYISFQVRSIAITAESGIINTTDNIENYQSLKANQQQLERKISQYLLLKTSQLKTSYIAQSQQLLLASKQLSQQANDKVVRQLISKYQAKLHELLSSAENNLNTSAQSTPSLHPIQQAFDQLSNILIAVDKRNNQLVHENIATIENASQQAKQLAIHGFWAIPVSLVIAWLFIYLITHPLNTLSEEILQLQQHKRQKPITSSSIKEINDVALSLETMRIRLRALELQKSSFIRHISHELKTPLAAIREGVELLYDHSLGDLNNQQQEVAGIIKTSTHRLQQHIEELLDFNIVLDSTSLQDSEKVNISTIIDQVLQQWQLEIKRKQLQLKLSLTTLEITCNPKHLNVIIDNIMSNAIKFSPTKSIISISTQLKEDQLHLTISDQGCGIAESELQKIFEPFYQGTTPHEINRLMPKGSGLGLTIVEELVQRLNGVIFIESKPKRKHGTQVNITLPRAKVN